MGNDEGEEGEGGEGGRREGSTTKLSRDTGIGFTCTREECNVVMFSPYCS